MAGGAIAGTDGLKEGLMPVRMKLRQFNGCTYMSIRCSPLQLNRNSREEQNLYGRTGSIPQGSRDTWESQYAIKANFVSKKYVPYRKATLLDCSRVAAQVQEETTALATRPDLTVRPAVENISEVCSSLLYRLSTQVVNTCTHQSQCTTVPSLMTYHAKREQESDTEHNAISPALAQRRG